MGGDIRTFSQKLGRLFVLGYFCANIDKIKEFFDFFLTNFELLKDYSLTIQYKSRYFNVLLEFGLEGFDFKTRNNMFVAS